MAFRQANLERLIKFNSAASSLFLDEYSRMIDKDIDKENTKPSQTIAPSSSRCLRKTWFRLRGTEVDKSCSRDRTLQFTAEVGTACHEVIQQRLSRYLGDRWIDVAEYLKANVNDHEFEVEKHGFETRIAFKDIPIRFACDGVIKLQGVTYLLEIKSSDFGSFDELTAPKPQHIDQVKCYGTMLHIDRVLFLYVDRQYGGLKCFEVVIKQQDKDAVNNNIKHVMDCVDSGLAPEPLPKGDSWCSSAMCPYFKTCAQYGR
jgi:hypothetical protein